MVAKMRSMWSIEPKQLSPKTWYHRKKPEHHFLLLKLSWSGLVEASFIKAPILHHFESGPHI